MTGKVSDRSISPFIYYERITQAKLNKGVISHLKVRSKNLKKRLEAIVASRRVLDHDTGLLKEDREDRAMEGVCDDILGIHKAPEPLLYRRHNHRAEVCTGR